jgi:hypothetical protein
MPPAKRAQPASPAPVVTTWRVVHGRAPAPTVPADTSPLPGPCATWETMDPGPGPGTGPSLADDEVTPRLGGLVRLVSPPEPPPGMSIKPEEVEAAFEWLVAPGPVEVPSIHAPQPLPAHAGSPAGQFVHLRVGRGGTK